MISCSEKHLDQNNAKMNVGVRGGISSVEVCHCDKRNRRKLLEASLVLTVTISKSCAEAKPPTVPVWP